jgi:hypothetical protein
MMTGENVRLKVEAAMARSGLHARQRSVWYDEEGRRHDPLSDRDAVRCLLHELDEIVAAEADQ